MTEGHLPEPRELHSDGAFYDLLIATLAGLIDRRMEMSDRENYAYPFVANACNFRAGSVTKLKEHSLEHRKVITCD
jgi:hypothetical protein